MQITINGNVQSFEMAQMTVAELVVKLNAKGKRIAVECNGEIIPRGEHAVAIIKDGDKLEIVGAVGGG